MVVMVVMVDHSSDEDDEHRSRQETLFFLPTCAVPSIGYSAVGPNAATYDMADSTLIRPGMPQLPQDFAANSYAENNDSSDTHLPSPTK
ncbi:hypothetical protein E4U41_001062 [Claviceps citrina]|nr:hypothetical protein E4U41_001062 [Claviceps citrina]